MRRPTEAERENPAGAAVAEGARTLPVQVKAGTEKETSSKKEAGVAKGALEAVELDGRKQYFELQNKWSTWIIRWITALIIFNAVLAVFVGFGWFNFEKYQWFITAVTVETFLQIVGMGYIAVNYLFSDSK